MKTFRRFMLFSTVLSLVLSSWLSVGAVTVGASDVRSIPGQVEAASVAGSAYPTFVRGQMALPISAQAGDAAGDAAGTASAFLAAHAAVFGIQDVQSELQTLASVVDSLGVTHVTQQQMHLGVPVYAALVKVHLNLGNNQALAIGNGYVAGIKLASVEPRLAGSVAQATSQKLLAGRVSQAPQLFVYPGVGAHRAAATARLTWIVEVTGLVARKAFVIDAQTGDLVDVLDRHYEGTRLETYDAENKETLPGTLVREDDEANTGDVDVDNAHNFADATLDYYLATHSRNSYDNAGAVVKSTANYGSSFQNAFWDGTQMVYGDGFAVLDVVGHELTHAVTEKTANLEYRWQSGALNESFSDIFGAMIDRDDWLMGEDLADLLGQDAIRDLQNPEQYNQPANTADWVATCQDNEGVHINSGIFNKAYYNIATALSKDKAEKIFYRALTEYLQPTSSFDDARLAVLQSTTDLYAGDEATVEQGFTDVDMSAGWAPAANDCTCTAVSSVDARTGKETLSLLYGVRDQVMASSASGRYYTQLYYQATADVSLLLLVRPDLRTRTRLLIADFKPGLQNLVIGNGGDSIVTSKMVSDVRTYLADLKTAAVDAGNDELAQTIEAEEARVDWSTLPGMTFAEAEIYIESLGGIFTVFLPAVRR